MQISIEDLKKQVDAGLQLPVMEHFYTIQGEGGNSGRASYFIRLGGCDVGCTWCDVKESWEAADHPVYSIETCIDWIQQAGAKDVVITGGEPAMYQLAALTSLLQKNSIGRWIDTSGAHPLTGEWDWVCLSPKKFKPCLDDSYKKAHELKVVIANRNDFKWAESHAEKVNKDCQLYLQVEWSRSDKLLPLIISYCKANPKWRISLQTHKYMDIP
jgi:organic radical activating enzyme